MNSSLAQSTRDLILDQLVAGQTSEAIQTYRQATGAESAEAERIVLRLQDLLETPDELSAADQAFLDNFRAGLRPTSSTDLLDRPHTSPAEQLAALASYVLLTALTFNLVGASILLITGAVGFWINPWVGLFASLLLAGPMFIAFPGILRGVVVRRLGIEGFVRSPGFGWEIALGFVLVISGILGSVLSERLVWMTQAQVVELAAPGASEADEIDRSAILWIQSSRVPAQPVGRLTETRRDRHGNTSRSEYLVRPLVRDSGRSARGTESDLCWWVGKAQSGFTRFQHPVLSLDAESPYFVDNPTHRADYEKAVFNALVNASGGTSSSSSSLPACTRVLERVPHPDEIRGALLSQLKRLALAVNVAFGVLLGLWGVAWVVRRSKSAGAA